MFCDLRTHWCRSVLFCLLSAAVLVPQIAYSALNAGDLTAARRESTTREGCLDRYLAILHDEISDPTDRHAGSGGGYIDHDYQIAQIITAMHNLLMPPAAHGRPQPRAEDLARLKAELAAEQTAEARHVLQILLALCGDSSSSGCLVSIVQGGGGLHVRVAAIEALCHVDCAKVVPDLIECLSDENTTTRYDYTDAAKRSSYPIRRAAAWSLRKLGVTVRELNESDYEADRSTAVRVVGAGIRDAQDEKARSLLRAVSRLGGEAAREFLQTFVKENEHDVLRAALVLEAKRLSAELNRE